MILQHASSRKFTFNTFHIHPQNLCNKILKSDYWRIELSFTTCNLFEYFMALLWKWSSAHHCWSCLIIIIQFPVSRYHQRDNLRTNMPWKSPKQEQIDSFEEKNLEIHAFWKSQVNIHAPTAAQTVWRRPADCLDRRSNTIVRISVMAGLASALSGLLYVENGKTIKC